MCSNAAATSRCETRRMRVAVVGHVEWVDFLHVERSPKPGEIVQATEAWQVAAGGGADAAVQLRKLAGSATADTRRSATTRWDAGRSTS